MESSVKTCKLLILVGGLLSIIGLVLRIKAVSDAYESETQMGAMGTVSLVILFSGLGLYAVGRISKYWYHD